MKKLLNAVSLFHVHRVCSMTAFLLLFKSPAWAQAVFVDNSPHRAETQANSHLILIGFLIATGAVLFFLFHRRYRAVATELKDITSELGTTRQRLDDTGKELEKEQKEQLKGKM